MQREPLQCSAHGPALPTYVCKHIGGAAGRAGFVFDRQSTEPWPDAVCDACAGEPPWTDEVALERIKLACSACWEEAFERDAASPLADEDRWLRAASSRSRAKQEHWKRGFRIDSFRRYHYCFDDGEAWLGFGDDGGFRVRCNAHVIGSWGRNSGTWLWGWANSHWQASVTEAIVRVKRRGEKEGVRSLTRSQFIATEREAWSLASAVLDTLPEVEGVYRAPGETGSLFLAVTGTRFTS
jgi:hypothetical protein